MNPFNPGPGLQPPYLAGRDEVLDKFSQMLQNIQIGRIENVLMHGLRGVGKTVLLERFVQICIDKKFLPVVRSQFSQKYTDPIQFVNTFKYDVDNAIEIFSRVEKAKERIQAVVNYLKPANIGIPGMISYEPSYDYNNRMPLEDYLAEYMIKKWNFVKKKDYHGIVFLFDEFHTVRDVKEKSWYVLTDLIGAMNEVQKKNCKCSLVLCGLPTLSVNVKLARSYAERMFQSVSIANLDKVSAQKAILEPLKKTDYSFSDELVSSIVKDADRYPYFIQFFAKEVIDHIDKTVIELEDYKKIKGLIMTKLRQDFFELRMEPLSVGQKNVLYAMASTQETNITFSTIIHTSNIPKGTLTKDLRRLEGKGLIYRPQRGVYQFTIPLFKEYLDGKLT